MKNLKKLVPVFALVLGLGLVFTQSAFKSNTAVRYHYMNNDDTDIDQVSSWTPITGTEPTCDNEKKLPCVIEVDGSLSTYLSNNDTVVKIFASDEFRSSKSGL